MSEPGDVITPSTMAWPTFGTERAVWIPCPAVFPDGDDERSWARRYSAQWWAKSGVSYRKSQVARLAKILSGMREAVYRPGQDHVALIHLPPPQQEPRRVQEPLPVGIGLWQLGGDRDARLRRLTNADDPQATQPPTVEEFWNDALGAGLKTLRHGHLPDGSVFGAVNYAFRSERYETDIRFSASCTDLSVLQAAMPDIDELARTTSLRHRNQD